MEEISIAFQKYENYWKKTAIGSNLQNDRTMNTLVSNKETRLPIVRTLKSQRNSAPTREYIVCGMTANSRKGTRRLKLSTLSLKDKKQK